MTPPDPGDLWEITRVIAHYARFADERRFEEMAELFTPDGRMLLFRPRSPQPAETPQGREELVAAFGALTVFEATGHVLAPSLVEVDGDVARGYTRCMAHHISETPEGRVRFTLADRYEDELVRTESGWLFRERRKYTDWTETAPLRQ